MDAEKITAYVDGELNGLERAAIEQAAATDPELRARIEAHKRLRAQLGSLFADTLSEPVPPELSAAVTAMPPAQIIPFRLKAFPVKRYIPMAGAMAASLVAGIALTLSLNHGPASDFKASGSQLMAQGKLAEVLTTQLASDETTTGAAKVGLTFRDASGAVCRTFETPDNDGLACHDTKGWRIDVLSKTAPRPTYSQAGSPLVMQAVMERIDGEAFDSGAEKDARNKGWKP